MFVFPTSRQICINLRAPTHRHKHRLALTQFKRRQKDILHKSKRRLPTASSNTSPQPHNGTSWGGQKKSVSLLTATIQTNAKGVKNQEGEKRRVRAWCRLNFRQRENCAAVRCEHSHSFDVSEENLESGEASALRKRKKANV